MSLVLSVYTHGKFPDVIGNVGNGSQELEEFRSCLLRNP